MRNVMSRNQNAAIAAETLEILERGFYQTPSGRKVSITADLERAVAGTRLYTPQELEGLETNSVLNFETNLEVTPETTLEATRLLSGEGDDVVLCLNFASAKNPGGGFLGGAQAQEESLARSSGLYPSLLSQPRFYEFHRQQHDLLYSDHMIYSPNVPVFRDDSGTFLEQAYRAAFITSPAPNAGAISTNQAHSLPLVPDVLRARVGRVLAVALQQGAKRLVLGAWGCGVFRNDPQTVARAFAHWLTGNGVYARAFAQVTFAVYDRSKDQATLEAFRRVFEGVR
jgi:uncharacterized protein (TIGR02452 family)